SAGLKIVDLRTCTFYIGPLRCEARSRCRAPPLKRLSRVCRRVPTTMCGIAGMMAIERGCVADPAVVRRMCDVITHRGPDDYGSYVNGPVGLGMRRLSIIDLSTGHQPIANEDETIWIVYNGEVYNFIELRDEL